MSKNWRPSKTDRDAEGEPGKTAASIAFDYQPRTRLVFGTDSVEGVGRLARGIGARKVLLVTDPGIVTAGHAGRVERLLGKEGLHVTIFSTVHENPTTRDVDACLRSAK